MLLHFIQQNQLIQSFQQIIWTDANEHQYIEECGTMNIFFRIGAKIVTPKISETILMVLLEIVL